MTGRNRNYDKNGQKEIQSLLQDSVLISKINFNPGKKKRAVK